MGNIAVKDTISYILSKDRNSDITSLMPNGLVNRFGTFGLIDDLTLTYDASGVKHRVIHSSTKPDVSQTGRLTTADTTDYVGNRVYLNGKLHIVLSGNGVF